ncbi:MAG: hypothetical protein NC393_14265 [Clostridium sp.]|nr:hypothetical protein [Clostridium sp.]MCM1173276.1 hypothetical protein [Clostridium sp.]MCM1209693.1 hypothetical protein [Ruminococcus sp.]
MRKLKKFAVSLALIGIMCSVAACGDDEDDKKTERTTVTTEATPKKTTERTEATEDTEDMEFTEDTEAEAPEAETSTTAPPLTYDVSFSTNDWTTLEFAWDGAVYQFPMTYQDIVDAGFTIGEQYMGETLDSNEYTMSISAKNDAGEKIYVRFKNFTEQDGRPITDCEIYGFGFDTDEYYDVNPAITICNGVTFGMTVDEVKGIMGEPDYYYASDDPDFDRKELEYYADGTPRTNQLQLEFIDGILAAITIINMD